MLHSKWIETIVGGFVALGLGSLLVLAMRISNLSLAGYGADSSYDVRAKFDNIGGLKVRSPVKMAGVTIGRVNAIELDPKTYTAVAVLQLEKRFNQIPTDTGASVYTAGLLGEQYISLEPGGSEEFLKGGGVITDTQSAIVFEQVLGQFLYGKAAESAGDKDAKE
ncbi:MAG: outer membrane lipid asymmetry maintenance protein MlaD [Gammaproteobacteria bacterium]